MSKFKLMTIGVLLLLNFSFAAAQNKTIVIPPPANELKSPDALTTEIAELRKTLQSLIKQMQLSTKDPRIVNAKADDSNQRILLGLEILTKAEERAEILRRQMIELTEKETNIKSKLVQMEEDLRSENIERNSNLYGSTRAPELRENRKRQLEIERSGLRTLLSRIEQSAATLEESVRQADLLVETLRKRFFPLLERAIVGENK